jgi:NADH:ubiquinone oxidoreductase subunit 5 (subunit L)/multisubunit Na+/H+ antiporter MnhA subunit
MTDQVILALAILTPVAGSLFLPLVGRASIKAASLASLCLVATSFVMSAMLLPVVLAARTVTFSLYLPMGLGFAVCADGLAVFTALVSSFISLIIVLYSTSYISHYDHQREYYSMVVLFLGAMMGIVYSANLILLYIFWEITAITSWRLIGFFREDRHVWCANKAFLVTVFGAVAMLLGFVSIYATTGSFDTGTLRTLMKGTPLPGFIAALMLIGILSKSATLPFHTWLPDAGVAPSPVTALLHAAVLVKIGVYVFARLFVATFTLSELSQTWLLVLAAASALVSAGAALVETDLKRLIAFSTVSQIAFIFLGFAVGNQVGVAGALLYILMHGLAKGGLFLCAGIIEQNTGTKDITKLGGLFRTMPVTAVSFLACSLSVMGIPPFGGFFSKYMVISGAIESGRIWIGFVFLAGAVLTMIYLLRVFNLVFLGDAKTPEVREASPIMIASVVVLAVFSLGAGLFVGAPSALAAIAARQIIGMAP